MSIITTDFKPHDCQEATVFQFKKWLTNVSRIIKTHEGFGALLDVIGSINTVAGEFFFKSKRMQENKSNLGILPIQQDSLGI